MMMKHATRLASLMNKNEESYLTEQEIVELLLLAQPVLDVFEQVKESLRGQFATDTRHWDTQLGQVIVSVGIEKKFDSEAMRTKEPDAWMSALMDKVNAGKIKLSKSDVDKERAAIYEVRQTATPKVIVKPAGGY